MSVIVAENLSLKRGENLVLDQVNLTIPAGAFIGVLGTNGAGKTTLFQAILGLLKPISGQLTVFGAPARRGNVRIGYLPQARNLSAHLRLEVGAFLKSSFGGARWGFSLDRAAARAISEALAMVGAENLMHRSISELSGGERQRVLIAQCLMGRPDILLLDEPLISLDPARVREMIALVRSLQQRLNLTVLFSAHELNPLLGSLDEVLYLGQRNAVLGPVEDVITAPVLSRLYGTQIDVVHVGSRIFVMAGDEAVEMGAHHHDHDHGHDHHGHHHD